MEQTGSGRFPPIGDGGDLAPGESFYREELQLAVRNRGMPLEGLRYDVTPTRMHYLLAHFDIPAVDRPGVQEREVSRLEFSDDGGESWSETQLGEPVSPHAWRSWSHSWTARSGRHILCVRAWDSEGAAQPREQNWSHQGMGNNMAQRVPVLVEQF